MSQEERRAFPRVGVGLAVNIHYHQEPALFLKGKVFDISEEGVGLAVTPAAGFSPVAGFQPGQGVDLDLLFPRAQVEVGATVRWVGPREDDGGFKLGVCLDDLPKNLYGRWVAGELAKQGGGG